MPIKMFLTIVLLGLSVACSSGWNSKDRCLVCYPARSGEHLATFEKTNDTFAIRTLVFREKSFGYWSATLLGAHYIFETRGQGDEEWREFMAFRHDNPEPINEDRSKFVNDRVTFVNDQVAFVYMGWMYAVTIDAGKTWNTWNGLEYPFQKGRMGYDGIRDVELLANGAGVMKIRLIGNDDLTELHTNDNGVSWNVDVK